MVQLVLAGTAWPLKNVAEEDFVDPGIAT